MRFAGIVIILFLLSCGTGDMGNARITGTVNKPAPGKVYLLRLSEQGLSNVDSAALNDKNEFSFSVNVQGTEFYRLNFMDRQMANVILSENDKVRVEVDGDNPGGQISIVGSRDTELMLAVDSIARKRQSDTQLLNAEAMQARQRGDVRTLSDITDQYYYLNDKHRKNLKAAIWSAQPSLAGLYGMNYLDIEEDFAFADSMAIAYNDILPDHLFTKDLVNQVNSMRSLTIGADAPEIALSTPDGDILKLSSLRGNYVLIDFWAAWCRPCRAENPNVLRLYKQYQGENFEIYGVSLDRTREAWLKAIEDDGLIWKHVSDLKHFQSEGARTYQVSAIPATYLIAPDGKIIGKNLRGESLRKKLEEIFG